VTPDTNLWAAVSRAVRTSSRFESDVTIKAGRAVVSGNSELTSERLTAYELGVRTQPRPDLSLDLALFVNQYDHLVGWIQSDGGLRNQLANSIFGNSHGAELAANWDVNRVWRLKLAYAWLQMHLEDDDPSRSGASPYIDDSAPHHQLSLRSWLDLTPRVELDVNLYYVDALEYYDTPAYPRLDLRLGWRPRPGLELSLIGKNLLDDTHAEFAIFGGGSSDSQGLVYTEVERSVMLQAKWHF
jgi:iron complex outermembrane receptor protein